MMVVRESGGEPLCCGVWRELKLNAQLLEGRTSSSMMAVV